MIEVDYRGLACPQPVMASKKAIENNPECGEYRILLDNKPAQENVMRFMAHNGFDVAPSEGDGDYIVTAKRDGSKEEPVPVSQEINGSDERDTLIMVTCNRIGSATPELGEKLMLNFLKTLPEMKSSIWQIVFVNDGVKLTLEGSETADAIKELEADGISILVCGTCLEFFGVTDKKAVGETTNMLDIITGLQVSKKVINM